MTKNACLCGELVYYEPGRQTPLVDIQPEGTTWYDTIHPKDSTGKQRKFQEQSLFFAIRENRVGIIQSTSLQSDELQSFLSRRQRRYFFPYSLMMASMASASGAASRAWRKSALWRSFAMLAKV